MTKFISSLCYNPFFFEGRYVDGFYFFQNGKIVASSNWFGSNNYYRWIEFPFEFKLKRKRDLNSKDAFYMTNSDNSSGDLRWDIYIPVELLEGFEKKENVKGWASDTLQNWHDTFSFLIKGEKRHLQKNDLGEIERVYSVDTWRVGDSCNYRFEKTEFGMLVDKTNEALEEKGIAISGHDLEQLLKAYQLKKK